LFHQTSIKKLLFGVPGICHYFEEDQLDQKKQTHTQQQPHNCLKRTFYLNLNLSPKIKHTKKYPKQNVENVLFNFGIFCVLIKVKPHLEIKLTILGDTYNIAEA